MIVCGILSTMVTFTDTDFSGRKMAESSLERIANPQGFIIVGSVVSEEWVVCVVDAVFGQQVDITLLRKSIDY